ncbi:hypothetical protein V8G54_037549 [Vigna mungo]|uniref:Ubiquitin-like protease family profile domain-containing protein n=1 Tax=Vigna mungo TaxID=3915 RepID=A0AAQ3RHL1_VIGMU
METTSAYEPLSRHEGKLSLDTKAKVMVHDSKLLTLNGFVSVIEGFHFRSAIEVLEVLGGSADKGQHCHLFSKWGVFWLSALLLMESYFVYPSTLVNSELSNSRSTIVYFWQAKEIVFLHRGSPLLKSFFWKGTLTLLWIVCPVSCCSVFWKVVVSMLRGVTSSPSTVEAFVAVVEVSSSSSPSGIEVLEEEVSIRAGRPSLTFFLQRGGFLVVGIVTWWIGKWTFGVFDFALESVCCFVIWETIFEYPGYELSGLLVCFGVFDFALESPEILDPIEVNMRLMKQMVRRWVPQHHSFRLRQELVPFNVVDVVMTLGFAVGGLEVRFDESIVGKVSELFESTTIKLKDLINIFDTIVVKEDVDVDVAKRVTNIPCLVLDDLDSLWNYDWSTAIHTYLVQSLHRCNKKILTGAIEDSLSISGAVVALQLWLYERLSLHGDSSFKVFPRLLRFRSIHFETDEIEVLLKKGEQNPIIRFALNLDHVGRSEEAAEKMDDSFDSAFAGRVEKMRRNNLRIISLKDEIAGLMRQISDARKTVIVDGEGTEECAGHAAEKGGHDGGAGEVDEEAANDEAAVDGSEEAGGEEGGHQEPAAEEGEPEEGGTEQSLLEEVAPQEAPIDKAGTEEATEQGGASVEAEPEVGPHDEAAPEEGADEVAGLGKVEDEVGAPEKGGPEEGATEQSLLEEVAPQEAPIVKAGTEEAIEQGGACVEAEPEVGPHDEAAPGKVEDEVGAPEKGGHEQRADEEGRDIEGADEEVGDEEPQQQPPPFIDMGDDDDDEVKSLGEPMEVEPLDTFVGDPRESVDLFHLHYLLTRKGIVHRYACEINGQLLTTKDCNSLGPRECVDNMVIIFATTVFMYFEKRSTGLIKRIIFSPMFAVIAVSATHFLEDNNKRIVNRHVWQVDDYQAYFHNDLVRVEDLLSADWVFIPVLSGGHWWCYALQVCSMKFFVIDSLEKGIRGRVGIDRSIAKNIKHLWSQLSNTLEDSKIDFNVIVAKIPVQPNTYDCGVIMMKVFEIWDGDDKYDGKSMPNYTNALPSICHYVSDYSKAVIAYQGMCNKTTRWLPGTSIHQCHSVSDYTDAVIAYQELWVKVNVLGFLGTSIHLCHSVSDYTEAVIAYQELCTKTSRWLPGVKVNVLGFLGTSIHLCEYVSDYTEAVIAYQELCTKTSRWLPGVKVNVLSFLGTSIHLCEYVSDYTHAVIAYQELCTKT